jgi:hypothetical protein
MWWLTYNDNTCTSGRCTSFKYSWWWALAPETCRVTLQKLNLHSVASSWCFHLKTEDIRKFWIRRTNWIVNVQVSLGEKGWKLICLFVQMAGTLTASFQHSVPCLPGYLVCKCSRKCCESQKNYALPSLIVDHSMRRNDGKIILCDKDATQDDHVQ